MDIRYFPATGGFPETDELVGKRANFHYASGSVLQQYYKDAHTMVWSGVSGEFAGVEQSEPTLRVFKIARSQYFITWYEKGTVASAAHGEVFEGGYPIAVFADFDRRIATAAYTNPKEDGSQYYIVDQATIELVEGF
jgi:hypothetical protein